MGWTTHFTNRQVSNDSILPKHTDQRHPDAQTLNHSDGWISVSLTQIINGLSKLPSAVIYLMLHSPPTLFLPPTSMQWSFAAKNSQAVCGDECGAEPDPSPESTEIIQHDDRKPATVLTSSVAQENQQGFPSTDNHHPIPPSWIKKKMLDPSLWLWSQQHFGEALKKNLQFHCNNQYL